MNTKKTPFIRIDEWHRDPKDAYVYAEDGNIKLNLDKCIPNSIEKLRQQDPQGTEDLGTFSMSRVAFKNSINLIVDYIDYFIEFYDEDKELPSLYIHWKKIIDSGENTLTPGEYHEMVLQNIFKESNIKRNIYRMVEDNYYIDITVDEKSGRKFESKEDFSNDNVKRFLAISMAMKIIIPPTDHYSTISSIMDQKGVSLNSLITKLFIQLMYKVGDVKGDEGADELLEKLYIFIGKKALKHVKDNQPLWEQESALRGVTENSHIDTLISKFIIYDNFFKLRFNNSMAAFLKSIINLQLHCTIEVTTYDSTPIRIDSTKGPDGIAAGLHKAEQQLAKIDESMSIIADKALVDIIERMEREVGEISIDEIEYYEKYLIHADWFHAYLLTNMFAKEFDGFQEQKIMSNRQYVKLVIIGKRRLLKQGYVELPWLLSSNPQGKLSNRLLRNTRILNRVKASETHQKLMDDKYKCLKNFKDDEDIAAISKVLNNAYLFNEYEKPELFGEPIEFDEDVISAELQRFIESI